MMIEIIQKENLYDDDPKTKKKKIIKRNITIKHNIHIGDILTASQIINSKGNVLKNKCRINVKDLGPITVHHSYEYMKDILSSQHDKQALIGFKIKKDNR